MKIIAVASQKGGCGKTTIVQNLARAAFESGNKTRILDFDEQLTSVTQYDKRVAEVGISDESEPKTYPASFPRMMNLIKAAENEETDCLFFDMPPSVTPETLDVCRVSDFVVVPTRPEPYDLESIQSTLKVVQAANVPSMVVINSIPQGGGDFAEEAHTFISVQCNFPVCDVRIPQRKNVTEASAGGFTVFKTAPNHAATKDFKKLWKAIDERVQASVPARVAS